MVKAREQNKTFIYTDTFNIDNPVHDFFLASDFHFNFIYLQICACYLKNVNDFIFISVFLERKYTTLIISGFPQNREIGKKPGIRK